MPTPIKPLDFWADAREVLQSFPADVRQDIGFALDEVQRGGTPGSAKPRPDIGRGVYAITTDDSGETYRTFYVARFAEAVYAFHIVHKKATKGIDLPKHQSDLAAARYKEIVDWRRSEGLG